MSEQGTLIRLFNPKTGDKIHELRRGSEAATIQDLAFEWLTGGYITCTSTKETIHVFKTMEIKEGDKSSDDKVVPENTKSYFSALSSLVSYAGSEWSFAQVKLQLDPQ